MTTNGSTGLGLQVDCPGCQALLAFTPEDLDLLEEGDMVTCCQCGQGLVVSGKHASLLVQPLGPVVTCPGCQAALTIGADVLALALEQAEGLEGAAVACPQCSAVVALEFSPA